MRFALVMKPQITLVFFGNNKELLSVPTSGDRVHSSLRRRASIKDIIEAVGVPHTEVFRLEQGGRDISFRYIPSGGDEIFVFPFDCEHNWQTVSLLRPHPFARLRFLVDLTALKLARNLRLLGLDSATIVDGDLRDIVNRANLEERVVLTRNRELLKIGALHFGQLLRSVDHKEQLLEVEERFKVSAAAQPMSRCLVCNEILQPVEKKSIEHRLKPLTRKYYHLFRECFSCRKLYWQGSHHDRMREMFDFLKQK